eukprot:CAMPEP_0181263306 /NCGR_PEP_ID=MMETSP1097-20121128/2514_1 /TAXON_ID=35684 /ORGANISM="Pseudopedinella elastica, Strain CCMP716" /LENGTH=196 /DNA_ID=CAMNT_0023362093 /DNA_START=28 /DNA_END=618 /DNA_ORIENTATION=+
MTPMANMRKSFKRRSRTPRARIVRAGCARWFSSRECAIYHMRATAIDNDMKQYTCCQGYYHQCSRVTGGQEQNCPECCLCIEAICCMSCSVSASRMLVMDRYQIHSDPCDRKLIRINNMLQCCSLLCDCAALIDPELKDCASIVDCFAEVFYCSLQACMVTQVHVEMKYRRGQGQAGGYTQAPTDEVPVAKKMYRN